MIAASGEHGINLVSLGGGGDPATGPTEIHGNYIGLDATGTGVLGNDEAGIEVGGSGEVEIGGEEPGDANYFAGGTVSGSISTAASRRKWSATPSGSTAKATPCRRRPTRCSPPRKVSPTLKTAPCSPATCCA